MVGDACVGFVAAYFLMAAGLKLKFRRSSARTLLDLLLPSFSPYIRNVSLAVFEAMVGIAVLIPGIQIAALVVVLAFSLIAAPLLLKAYRTADKETPCGCNGGQDKPFRPVALSRNVALAAAAILGITKPWSWSLLGYHTAAALLVGIAAATLLQLFPWVKGSRSLPNVRIDPNRAISDQCGDWKPTRSALERQLWNSAAGQSLRRADVRRTDADIWNDGCFGYAAYPGKNGYSDVLYLVSNHRGLPGRSSLTILDVETSAVLERSRFEQ
jgi:hypothetical protein